MSGKIAIQGVKGSNHHLMTNILFGDQIGGFELLECDSFAELGRALAGGDVDFAVMAVENSIAGSIMENLDVLTRLNLKAIAEGYLRIEHCLIATPESELADISYVYSHEMALKQCSHFLQENRLAPREYSDTAAAVGHIAGKGERRYAAIAPAIAAELYGMKILKKGIENETTNYTRFLLLVRDKTETLEQLLPPTVPANPKHWKAAIAYTLPHEHGALAKSLTRFAELGFNLTKIESRPIIGQNWNYRFYVDFISTEASEQISDQLLGLEKQGLISGLNIIGIFPKGDES